MTNVAEIGRLKRSPRCPENQFKIYKMFKYMFQIHLNISKTSANIVVSFFIIRLRENSLEIDAKNDELERGHFKKIKLAIFSMKITNEFDEMFAIF